MINQEKLNLLWKLSSELRTISIDQENDFVIDSIDEIFNHNPPIWLTDSFIFGAQTNFYENKLMILYDEIELLQNTIKNKFNNLKKNSHFNEEQYLNKLKEEINILEKNSEELSNSQEISINSTSEQHYFEILEKIKIFKNKIYILEEEEEELEKELNNCHDELIKTQEDQELLEKQSKETIFIIKE